MTPPRLTETNGWVDGITHHRSPFYTRGGMSVPRGILGLVVHTMVGNLPGTDSEFMHTHYSSHFGTGQDGSLIQWVSIRGDASEAQEAGNPNWYSIEDADNLNPRNPFTPLQINRLGQVFELTSRVGNYPLQLTNSPSGEGLGWHGMGGVAWGNHPDCPGSVRRAQFPDILSIAKAIRHGGVAVTQWTTEGMLSLVDLAKQQKTTVTQILEHTIAAGNGDLAMNVAFYVNAGDLNAKMPKGLVLTIPTP